jgi:hypothetical protein
MARRRTLKSLLREVPKLKGISKASTLMLVVRVLQWIMSPQEASLHESINRAVRIYDLLHAAKRWHEEP